MADWKPGDLCQVRMGKRWVDAEVHSLSGDGAVRVAMYGPSSRADFSLHWTDAEDLRPRPGKRGKLPEPKAEEYRPTNAGLVAATIAAAERGWLDFEAMGEGSTGGHHDGVLALRTKAALKPVPKPTTARSLAYLAHVRRHPCCSCGATEAIHAHHVASGGMGAKASDYLTAPLCGVCHQHLHATATLPGEEPDQSKWTLWEAAARCLEKWITREGER